MTKDLKSKNMTTSSDSLEGTHRQADDHHSHKHDRDHSHAHAHAHAHAHNHDHGHHHHPVPQNFNKAFLFGIVLNLLFVGIEAAYGYWAHSLALIADAGHNLSDVLGLVLAWVALFLMKKKPSTTFTYGFRSSTIWAAFLNAFLLLIAIGGVVWAAIERFDRPVEVQSTTVMVVAAVGILINGFTAFLFSSGQKHDLNLRGAYLHMLADAFVSAGVVVAGLIMQRTQWFWVDPLVSIVVSIVIVKGAFELLKDSLQMALNAVPSSIQLSEVAAYLKNQKGVKEVHDLHVWAMSTTETALTVHLVMPDGHPGDHFLHHLADYLEKSFKIHHSTIQVEIGDDPKHPCRLAPDEVV